MELQDDSDDSMELADRITDMPFEPKQWVVVAYTGKKSVLNYIGQVVEVFDRVKLLHIKILKKQPAILQIYRKQI